MADSERLRKTGLIKRPLPYIRLRYIPSHHPMGVEVVGVLAYGVLHHADPDRSVVVICLHDLVSEFLIQVFRVERVG